MTRVNRFTLSGLFYYNSLDWSISHSKGSDKFLLLLCFKEIPVFNANSVDLDQHSGSALRSDLGLHHLPITFLGFPGLKWINTFTFHGACFSRGLMAVFC